MTDSSRPTRIKVIRKSMKASPDQTESLLWGDCLFCTDAAMTDYDWVLVYDEFPRTPVGTIRNETEPLLCPPDQTILITVEPPSIKIYSRAYTSQFGTVLTTHSIRDLPHPGHTLGRGCLEWLYIKPMQEILDQKEFPKTKCSPPSAPPSSIRIPCIKSAMILRVTWRTVCRNWTGSDTASGK